MIFDKGHIEPHGDPFLDYNPRPPPLQDSDNVPKFAFLPSHQSLA
jgi:hypothetical protein